MTEITTLEIKGHKTDQQKNDQDVLHSDSLYPKYDFTKRNVDISMPEVISTNDISKISKFNFYGIPNNVIRTILEIAKKCEINANDICWNFYIYSDGTITIGHNMAIIKEKLDEIEKAYEKFRNRKHFNFIRFTNKPFDCKTFDEFYKNKTKSFFIDKITDNFLVEGYLLDDVNKIDTLITYDLYEEYNFTTNTHCGEEIIEIYEIENIANMNFLDVDNHIIELVLRIAERYDVTDRAVNFVINEDGTIKLGGNMRKIKNNLEKIKNAWYRSREHTYQGRFSTISFSLK